MLETIDKFAKGVKTYLAAGTGVMVVAILQSQGVDAVGFVDTVTELAKDTVTQVVSIYSLVIVTLRKAMPDKRGAQ